MPEILKDLGKTEVDCLISTDDDATRHSGQRGVVVAHRGHDCRCTSAVRIGLRLADFQCFQQFRALDTGMK